FDPHLRLPPPIYQPLTPKARSPTAMESAVWSPIRRIALLPPSRTTDYSRNLHPLLPFPKRPASHKARCFLTFESGRGVPPRPLAGANLCSSPFAPTLSRFTSVSSSHAVSGSGGGGDGVDGGSGGGGGDGGSSGGETVAKPVAGDLEDVPALGADVIVLHVGGMSCGGCAASVKRILESQPQVSSAIVNLEKEMAFIWTVPEAKVVQDWQQELGEKLAKHLTTCGFKSNLQGNF
ncbi:unnamed protein product, partial [Musa hybrid cultivar]